MELGCYGDSGGPLFVVTNDREQTPVCLYGIVSYGVKYCWPIGEQVFTRASAYRNWISEMIPGWKMDD